jgi:hypothetical protein
MRLLALVLALVCPAAAYEVTCDFYLDEGLCLVSVEEVTVITSIGESCKKLYHVPSVLAVSITDSDGVQLSDENAFRRARRAPGRQPRARAPECRSR